MSDASARHEHDRPGGGTPSPWIVRHAGLMAPGARVLDLACGTGRHARWLAARGCRVLAVDRNPDALAAIAGVSGIETACVDLERGEWPPGSQEYDAIVVANYLHRPLFPRILGALGAAGALLYETFARGNECYGRPSNPSFLLAPGELLTVVGACLKVVAFEEGHSVAAGRDAVIQRIAAVGPGHPWPALLPPSAPLE